MFVRRVKSLVRFIQTTTTNTLRTTTIRQLEEHRRQLEEEAEQERLEEERLAKGLEEMRADEERKAEEKREAEKRAEERRKQEEEEEARVTKAFAQKEAELLKKQLEEAKKKKELKRSRPESETETEVEAELEKEGEEQTGESAMLDGQIMWRTKAGRICRECRKRDHKCLWPEASSCTKACHLCSALKVKCLVPGEESSEARPSTKRKVAMDKGKGKAKEARETKSEPEFGFRELVEELRGLRLDLREFRTDLQSTHHVAVQVSNRTADIADSVEDLARYFVPYP